MEENRGLWDAPGSAFVPDATAVAAIAAVATGDVRIVFDDVVVNGQVAVPEPGVMGLLAAGATVLALRRNNRPRKPGV